MLQADQHRYVLGIAGQNVVLRGEGQGFRSETGL